MRGDPTRGRLSFLPTGPEEHARCRSLRRTAADATTSKRSQLVSPTLTRQRLCGVHLRVLEFLSEAPDLCAGVTPSGAHLRRACMVLSTLRLSEPLSISDASIQSLCVGNISSTRRSISMAGDAPIVSIDSIVAIEYIILPYSSLIYLYMIGTEVTVYKPRSYCKDTIDYLSFTGQNHPSL